MPIFILLPNVAAALGLVILPLLAAPQAIHPLAADMARSELSQSSPPAAALEAAPPNREATNDH